jgi:hypothetical protein
MKIRNVGTKGMTILANRADFGWSLLLAVLILRGTECFLAMSFRRG